VLDLKNPDHEAALRWACEIKADIDAGKIALVATGSRSGKTLKSEALDALSSPASAAELIRQLVERAGSGVEAECVRGIQWRIAYYIGSEREWFAVNDADGKVLATIPALIIRLLALAPNAGAEAVLQALRGDA